MCGIIGVINHAGKFQVGMENIIKQLLWLDTIRGDDSTGLYAFTKEGQLEWAKQCVDGWSFVYHNDDAKKILRRAEDHLFIMGHNRSATMGDADNPDHAHPIVIKEKLALVHNGTLNNWPNRPWHNQQEKDGEYAHDSTAIAHLIANEGVQNFVDGCFGAYSLVWHDLTDDTFHFLRNEDRPMALVHTENCIFFGSEIGLLMWVIQRNNLRPIKHMFTSPMTHYTFEMGASEPTEQLIRKNYYSGPGRRFPRSSSSTSHGSASQPVVDLFTRRDPWDDGEGAAGDFHERQVRRIASELGAREKEVSEEGKETAETKGNEGTRIHRRPRVPATTDGKPHGKSMDRWKSFGVGDAVLFSCNNYGEVRPNDSGPQYSIDGDYAVRADFPEILIKGMVKVHELSREQLQKTNFFLWGTIKAIVALETGNVVLWVRGVKESKVPDPGQQKLKKNILIANESGEVVGEISGDDEIAEATVLVGPAVDTAGKQAGILPDPKLSKPKKNHGALLEGKEVCQGCKELTSKSKLRFLEEVYPNSAGRADTSTSFRVCTDCVETYAVDRTKVVPTAAKNRLVKSTTIKHYQ